MIISALCLHPPLNDNHTMIINALCLYPPLNRHHLPQASRKDSSPGLPPSTSSCRPCLIAEHRQTPQAPHRLVMNGWYWCLLEWHWYVLSQYVLSTAAQVGPHAHLWQSTHSDGFGEGKAWEGTYNPRRFPHSEPRRINFAGLKNPGFPTILVKVQIKCMCALYICEK